MIKLKLQVVTDEPVLEAQDKINKYIADTKIDAGLQGITFEKMYLIHEANQPEAPLLLPDDACVRDIISRFRGMDGLTLTEAFGILKRAEMELMHTHFMLPPPDPQTT